MEGRRGVGRRGKVAENSPSMHPLYRTSANMAVVARRGIPQAWESQTTVMKLQADATLAGFAREREGSAAVACEQ